MFGIGPFGAERLPDAPFERQFIRLGMNGMPADGLGMTYVFDILRASRRRHQAAFLSSFVIRHMKNDASQQMSEFPFANIQ